MTAHDFRLIALSMPRAEEIVRYRHSDFRVGFDMFATVEDSGDIAVLMLTPEQQTAFIKKEPHVFAPVSGASGRSGATNVRLGMADPQTVEMALSAALSNVTSKPPVKPRPRAT